MHVSICSYPVQNALNILPINAGSYDIKKSGAIGFDVTLKGHNKFYR